MDTASRRGSWAVKRGYSSIYKIKTNKRWRIIKLRVAYLNKIHNSFKEIMLEQLNSHMKKKMKLDPYLTPYTKLA